MSTASPPDHPDVIPDVAQEATAAIAPVQPVPSGVTTYPLLSIDPAKIGDFTPSARLVVNASGVAFLAYEDNATDPVVLILLNQGASQDPAARDRLAGQVDRMDIDTVIARGGLSQDSGRLGHKFRSEDDDPLQGAAFEQSPWVGLAFDQTERGVEEARRILAEVDLSWHPQQGHPTGPDYNLHWSDQVNPGPTRVWPLPWPGRRERGGRLSILTAWFLMLLLAALAVLIAILLFSRAPQTPPRPPISTSESTQSGSGGGESESSSGSGSGQSNSGSGTGDGSSSSSPNNSPPSPPPI